MIDQAESLEAIGENYTTVADQNDWYNYAKGRTYPDLDSNGEIKQELINEIYIDVYRTEKISSIDYDNTEDNKLDFNITTEAKDSDGDEHEYSGDEEGIITLYDIPEGYIDFYVTADSGASKYKIDIIIKYHEEEYRPGFSTINFYSGTFHLFNLVILLVLIVVNLFKGLQDTVIIIMKCLNLQQIGLNVMDH